VPTRLGISGYSDCFQDWGTRWWNFDFWAGWEQFADQPLARVCAEQWRQPHEAALAWIEQRGPDWHRLRFEDVVGSQSARREAFGALARWMDVDGVQRLADVQLPPLMATAPPRRRRWAARSEMLLPALTGDEVEDLAGRLGYADRDTWL
ncbi:MAG TPA: hypothetical protein VG795_14505, partial [Acidimicrobiia bacterium]|nr:hypothetical protein [Acidimicrobiia bacterium]